MSKSRRLTSTFFPDKKNCLADMLVNFFLLDKVTLEEHGTTKKLSITFLLRSGQLICFDPSSISSTSIKNERCKLHENTIVSYLHTLMLGERWIEKSFTFESTYDYSGVCGITA